MATARDKCPLLVTPLGMKKVTKYLRGKIYIPKAIAEEVGLEEGDRVEVSVGGPKTLVVRLLKETPDEVLERLLEEPLEIGVPDRIERSEIYEDLR